MPSDEPRHYSTHHVRNGYCCTDPRDELHDFTTYRQVRHRFAGVRTREDSMSASKTGIGGKRRSTAPGLLATASLALLLLLVGGGWSPARATGPALWFASPQQQPGPPGAVGGLVEIRPFWLSASGTPAQVKIEETAEPLANTSGLAFQANGSLWVCTLNNTVLKFTFGQLESLGVNPHPAPEATITSSAFKFNIGCVLSPSGSLWVVDASNNAVHKISRAQLIAATTAGGPQTSLLQ